MNTFNQSRFKKGIRSSVLGKNKNLTHLCVWLRVSIIHNITGTEVYFLEEEIYKKALIMVYKTPKKEKNNLIEIFRYIPSNYSLWNRLVILAQHMIDKNIDNILEMAKEKSEKFYKKKDKKNITT